MSFIARIIGLAMTVTATASVSGQTLQEAREAYRTGDFAAAAPVLSAHADKEPKNAALHLEAGNAWRYAGDVERARKYLLKAGAEGKLALAELAFAQYDFEQAEEQLDAYVAARKKAKKQPEAEAETLRQKLLLGRGMFDRVERVEVIDSINVDRDDFFRFYRLARTAGAIVGTDDLSTALTGGQAIDETATAYLTEDATRLIWSMPTDSGEYRLFQTWQLADGTYEPPVALGAHLAGGGDANFPFLMTDGVTLYFANDGEESLGGYDIFLARSDESGRFLQPLNVGMPYNSPYDDYLLVIDEVNGIGWWATDRNQLPGQVTIYAFVPRDMRINYDVDTENLASLAMLRSIADTQPEGADYTGLLTAMRRNETVRDQSEPLFEIELPDGRIARRVEDLHTAMARSQVRKWLEARDALDAKERKLQEMRARYESGSRNLGQDILNMEQQVEADRKSLDNLERAVIQSES